MLAVQHNLMAMNANRNLSGVSTGLSKSTEKLSSGYRINRAGDDAAGLAISEKMRGQIRGLDRASTNSQDGISLIQTAEGALTETHSILQRMRELAVQAASDTNTDDDRTQLQNEIDQLTNEVDRIATTTEFNTKKLLDGSVKGAVSAKEGTFKAEGTFKNGLVSLNTANVTSVIGVTDVIRIVIKKDITAAADITDSAIFCVSSLFNKGKVTISEGGKIILSGNLMMSGDCSVISVGTPAGDDIDLTINNFDKLKAGDVITISLGELTASAAAATGKDAVRLQVGANAGQEVMLGVNSMKASDLRITNPTSGNSLDVTNQADASKAISAYDMALQKVSTERAKLGAVQNRLEHTIANLDTSAENLQAAESRIRDTDMADEMTNYSKNNILMQAGQSMLAQANQSTQGVLSLLQ